jgi:hypothetical protein
VTMAEGIGETFAFELDRAHSTVGF